MQENNSFYTATFFHEIAEVWVIPTDRAVADAECSMSQPLKRQTCTSTIHDKIALIFIYVSDMLYQRHFIYKKTLLNQINTNTNKIQEQN